MLNKAKQRLIEIASEYSSEVDFKAKNLPKYLLAKKQRVIRIVWPPTKPIEDTRIKGIFKLYRSKTLVYIGHSTKDIVAEVEATDIDHSYFLYYPLRSDSDIMTLGPYLANRYRLTANKNIGNTPLSYRIADIAQILGPARSSKDLS